MEVIDQPPRRAVLVAVSQQTFGEEDAALAAFDIELAVEAVWRLRRDEINYAADRLRTVRNLAAAFEHFDALHAVDRRRVVHLRLTVRGERDWQAVLKHQHLAATVGVQAAHADVQPHRHRPGILAQGNARNPAEHFVGIERF